MAMEVKLQHAETASAPRMGYRNYANQNAGGVGPAWLFRAKLDVGRYSGGLSNDPDFDCAVQFPMHDFELWPQADRL